MRRWLRRGFVLFTTTATLVVVSGCNMLPGAVTDLKVGDCFDMPAQDSDISDVQHRPCNEPHDAEVIAVLTHPAAPGEAFPVVSGFDDYIEENCIPAFEQYTGRSFDTEVELGIGYLHPSLSGWGDGDRGFTCHASRNDDAKLSASVRANE